jgi:hypothetical protein
MKYKSIIARRNFKKIEKWSFFAKKASKMGKIPQKRACFREKKKGPSFG